MKATNLGTEQDGYADPHFECPRALENPVHFRRPAHWDRDRTCSYCGSINETLFFEAIESGCEIGPTDKDYKVYIDVPNPLAGQMIVRGGANYEQTGEGWVKLTPENIETLPFERPVDREHHRERMKQGDYWVRPYLEGPTKHAKFYFQHMSKEGRQRFVALLNAKKLKIGYPGHFYVLPFFVR